MGVGKRLKIALRERKMTIKELAELSKVSLNTLYSITKRDTENVDDIILDRISSTLGLSWTFFMGCTTFEDLELLEKNKVCILTMLEKDGLFSQNGREYSDIPNYEFWQLLSKYVADVTLDEHRRIQLVYDFTAEEYVDLYHKESNNNSTSSGNRPSVSIHDLEKWIAEENSPFFPYHLDEDEIVQKLLEVFLKLERFWQVSVIEDAERYLEYQNKDKKA